MATSENRGKRNSDDTDAVPSSKRHESTSSDIRIVPLNTNLAGLGLTEPANYVACIIPKSLTTVFEKILKETIERGLTSQHADNDEHSEDQDVASEIFCNEFIHDFGKVKDNFTKKLREFSDYDLRHEVPRGKFNVFKDYRRKLTKWFVTGHHLVNNLTTPSETKKFLKLRTSFSPAISDQSVIQEVRSKLKTTSDRCELVLTESAIHSAFDMNKEVSDILRQTTEDSDTGLIKILMKAYRSISRKYNYLSRPVHDDDIHGRGRPPRPQPPPPRQRTSYNRQQQHTYRHPRRESFDSEREYRYPRRANDYDRYPTERSHYRRYHEDFPPLERQQTNYRRFKRNPQYQDRDYDYDDVFEPEDQPFDGRRRSYRD
jgi:hypothetical protein